MNDAPVFGGVNRVADIEAASDFEKKHTPFLSCERVDDRVIVDVKVGHWVPHPNMPDHFIQWIDVLADDLPVARFAMSAVAADPSCRCVLNVETGTRISAVENCNLHGLWFAETVAP